MTKFKLSVLLVFSLILIQISSQSVSVKDINGNAYIGVKIGDQVWSSTNLETENFRNGEIIPKAKTAQEWRIANLKKEPAWCYLGFDSKYAKYGKYYNWYAVFDRRGIAPTGWRIPSHKDFKLLFYTIGNYKDGWDIDMIKYTANACKLKSKSSWKKSNIGYGSNENGTDDYGFNWKYSLKVDTQGQVAGSPYFKLESLVDLSFNESALWTIREDEKRGGSIAVRLTNRSDRCISTAELWTYPPGTGFPVRIIKN